MHVCAGRPCPALGAAGAMRAPGRFDTVDFSLRAAVWTRPHHGGDRRMEVTGACHARRHAPPACDCCRAHRRAELLSSARRQRWGARSHRLSRRRRQAAAARALLWPIHHGPSSATADPMPSRSMIEHAILRSSGTGSRRGRWRAARSPAADARPAQGGRRRMSAGVLSLRTVHVAAVWGRGPAVCSVGGSGAVHMVAGVGWPGRSEAFGQSERHTWLSWCGMCAARVSMELSVRRLLLRSVFAAVGGASTFIHCVQCRSAHLLCHVLMTCDV